MTSTVNFLTCFAPEYTKECNKSFSNKKSNNLVFAKSASLYKMYDNQSMWTAL